MYGGHSDMQRMKGQGTPVPNGPKDQNYSSFQNYTNPMTSSMAAATPAPDPYMSSYYMSTPYQAFGVGEGTWSNGGEHMQTFLGSYGGQVGYDSHSAIDGIFNSGSFGGFNPPGFNYGFHGNGDYSGWGGSDVRAGTKHYDEYYQRNVYADERVKSIEQGVQGLSFADSKPGQDVSKESEVHCSSTNGSGDKLGSSSPSGAGEPNSTLSSLSQPKKGLSWANVASQPAKPQPSRRRDKPSMPSIVPGRHMDIGTWDSKNGGGPKPVAPPPAPRPAWEASRGSSRTTTTTFSTPPPRTPPQAAAPPPPPSPQPQMSQQQMASPQQQMASQQGSPQQQMGH